MIVCPSQNLVFVHIPKCAGMAVRGQLSRCGPDRVVLEGLRPHATLGALDHSHIPLDQLREHFPEIYASLRSCDSFAIVRDPLDRFGSALRQMLWQYHERPMTLIPRDELRELTLRMLDRIAAQIDAPSHRFIHFIRQTRFVDDEGRQVTKYLVPLDLVPDFIGFLSRRTGLPMQKDARANQNVDLKVRGQAGRIAFRVNDVLRRSLPAGLHARIKDGALSVLSTRKSAAEAAGILDLPEVRAFVAERYVDDLRLYREVNARHDEIRAGLAGNRLDRLSADGPRQERPELS